MLRFRLLFIISFLALLVAGIAFWVSANDNDDEKVTLSDVPIKVIEAANKAVPGGEITAVEKEEEDSQIIYEVEKVVDGIEYEIEVTADGVVKDVEKEGDDKADDDGDDEEVEVALTDVPENVLKAAQEAVPEGNIKKVEKDVEDGVVVYDVEIFVRYEVEVTADGVVKEVEKGNDDEDSEADGDDD